MKLSRKLPAAVLLLYCADSIAAGDAFEPPAIPEWPTALPEARVDDGGTTCLPADLADAIAEHIARLEANHGIFAVQLAGLEEIHAAELAAAERVTEARADLRVAEADASEWGARILFGAGGFMLATAIALIQR